MKGTATIAAAVIKFFMLIDDFHGIVEVPPITAR